MAEIAIIMGKSSSGKDKIFKQLISDESLNLQTIIMYTTRPMREGEQEGMEYHFVDEDTVNKMEKENKIIELRSYQTVHGVWRYFTADDGQINLEDGKYLAIGTLESYQRFCNYFGKEHLLPIYIDVDDGIRLTRALEREKKQQNPKYAEMCRRFLSDCSDFDEENIEKAGIKKRYKNNEVLEDCINEIKKDIIQELNIVKN